MQESESNFNFNLFFRQFLTHLRFQRLEMSDDEESEGSLKNFIADSDTDESDAETTASSASSVASDDSRKKGRNKTPKVPVKRRTRANKSECRLEICRFSIDEIDLFSFLCLGLQLRNLLSIRSYHRQK